MAESICIGILIPYMYQMKRSIRQITGTAKPNSQSMDDSFNRPLSGRVNIIELRESKVSGFPEEFQNTKLTVKR